MDIALKKLEWRGLGMGGEGETKLSFHFSKNLGGAG